MVWWQFQIRINFTLSGRTLARCMSDGSVAAGVTKRCPDTDPVPGPPAAPWNKKPNEKNNRNFIFSIRFWAARQEGRSLAQSDLVLVTWRIFVWCVVALSLPCCAVWLLKLWFHLCLRACGSRYCCYHFTSPRPPYLSFSSLQTSLTNAKHPALLFHLC